MSQMLQKHSEFNSCFIIGYVSFSVHTEWDEIRRCGQMNSLQPWQVENHLRMYITSNLEDDELEKVNVGSTNVKQEQDFIFSNLQIQ